MWSLRNPEELGTGAAIVMAGALLALLTGCDDAPVFDAPVCTFTFAPTSDEEFATYEARWTSDATTPPEAWLTVERSLAPCSLVGACDDGATYEPVREVSSGGAARLSTGPLVLDGGFGYRALLELDDPAACSNLAPRRWRLEKEPPIRPLRTPSAVAGTTFAASGTTFELSQSGFGGQMLAGMLHVPWLPLFTVDLIDGGRLEATLAYVDEVDPGQPAQRVCTSTVALTGTFDNPRFETDPVSLTVVTNAGSTRIHDVVIEGELLADGAAMGDVRFSGMVDLRDLASEYGIELDAVCAAEWLTCQPCADSPYCTRIEAHNVTAEARDITIVRGSDACGIEGEVARWDYELGLIHAVERDGSEVRAVDFTGATLWTTDVGSEVSTLLYDVVLDGVIAAHLAEDGTWAWWRLDRATGALLESGADSLPEGAVLSNLSVDGVPLGALPGGLNPGGFACSVSALAVGAVPGGAVWLSLCAAVARRRGARTRNQANER